MSNVATIDPDTIVAGLAIFSWDQDLVVLDHSRAIRAPRGLPWEDRTDIIARKISTTLYKYKVHRVILEYPHLFNSPKGLATSNSGALVKLAFAAGAIYQSILSTFPLRPYPPPQITLVYPQTWKGNTPKEVTLARIQRHWDVSPQDDNEADAIGIGDWFFRKSPENIEKSYQFSSAP